MSNCEDSVREIPVGQKGSFSAGLDTCSPWGLAPGAGRGGRRQDPPGPSLSPLRGPSGQPPGSTCGHVII